MVPDGEVGLYFGLIDADEYVLLEVLDELVLLAAIVLFQEDV